MLEQNNEHYMSEVIFVFQDIEGNKYKQINKIGKGEYHHGFVELWSDCSNLSHGLCFG